MSRFVRLTFSDFARLVDGFDWKRKVLAVHVHHTWRPNHAQWQGLKSVEGMWQTNGWSDIAQHVTVDPEGFVWTGRNWNQPPVSAKSFNGTTAAGPFMFETVGDFDIACDPFGGPQKETVLRITACLLDKFELGIEAVRFHNEISAKSCPGTAIDRLSFLAEVKACRSPGGARARRGRSDTDALTYDRQSIEAVKKLIEGGPQAKEAEDSEPDDGPERVFERAVPQTRAMSRGGLSAADRQKLRRHVINSRDGRLSTDGMFTTSPADVQRIFAEHIPAFAQGLEAGKPLRLAFYAHGGLNNEQVGLQIALNQVDWWLANGVYPLFFVWETGFLETLGQILSPSRAMLPGGRGIVNELGDRITEALAHNLGGVGIWSQMKLAAARGVDSGGATTVTVEELHGLLDAVTDRQVELHAVGHSAGSIFHCWFVPKVTARAGTTFKTLSLLAPAIRVDDFALRLLPIMGDKVTKTTIFTMAKDLELADSLGAFYGKSLLYLIYHALEPDTETPILGLDECLHADARLRHAFGLMGQSSTMGGSVIWSRTQATSGPDASTATSHGGFDNDVPTMNAVIRRMLGLHHEPLEQEFPADTRAAPAMVTLRDPIEYLPEPYRSQLVAESVQSAPPILALAPAVPGLVAAPAVVAAAMSGRRRALCVGINAYPAAPLSGCIADAQLWAKTLEQLGFDTPLLLTDDDAQRERILGELERLIGSSGPGDQVVFQYSGHGTQLDDTDADEDDALDEAICPVDFDDGAFIIDDDFAQVFARIPHGVAVTAFFDCCHSGENTRLAVGRPGLSTTGARPRYIRATPAMQEQHKAFRARSGRRGLARSGDRSRMRQVVFSACRSDELAYENAGQGDFTRFTIPLLARSVGMPHRQFVEAVIQAFGSARRQTPELDCADSMRDQPLLGSVPNGGRALAAGGGGPLQAWARVVDAMAAALRASS
jgi:hypothetical protein